MPNDWCDVQRGCISKTDYIITLSAVLLVGYMIYTGFLHETYVVVLVLLGLLSIVDTFPKKLRMDGLRLWIALAQFVLVIYLCYVLYKTGEMSGFAGIACLAMVAFMLIIVRDRYKKHMGWA